MNEEDLKDISKVNKISVNKPLTNKWKKHLVDYKNYTKAYLKHYKKSLTGNLISLSQYPYMKARAEVLYQQLFEAKKKNLLTEEQVQKLEKIQNNVSN